MPRQSPFSDIDDRIRYIAAQLGLETVLWKYDSNDWKVGFVSFRHKARDGESVARDRVSRVRTFSCARTFARVRLWLRCWRYIE
jgi:peptidoglycan/xylan/chitin deacetylase (PgdA/CDA1 family)